MEPNLKKSVEMSPELHRRVKATAASRGISLKEATRQAYEGWLNADSKPIPGQFRPSPHSALIDALEGLMSGEDEDQKELLKLVLKRYMPERGRRKKSA